MSSSEVTIPETSTALIPAGNMSILSEGMTTLIPDSSPGQIINVNVLQDGSLTGIDSNRQYILAQSADGTTVLVEASQLTMFADHSIPLYDGGNVFQLAPQTAPDSGVLNKEVAVGESQGILLEEGAEKENQYVREEDLILPPDKKNYKCAYCSMEFHRSKHLHRHLKQHAEDKPNHCSECSAVFNKQQNLVLHEAVHQTSDFHCPECKRTFSRMASLKSHLMLHETEENLVCSECGDEFGTEFKLAKHMQDHMKELAMDQTFMCRTCSKCFPKLSALREHQRIHYKLKISLHRRHYKKNIDRTTFVHKCYFCGKQFQKPSQLLRHNRIHTGERPYKCKMCDRAFNQKGALQIHYIKHSGERPFVCEFCNAAFAQKGNLRNHIKRVHSIIEGSDAVHKCHLCPCLFRKLGSLNAHMSRIHTTSVISYIEVPAGNEVITTQNVNSIIDQLTELSKESRQREKENPHRDKAAVDSSDILQQALENSGLASADQPKARPFVMTVADTATGVLRRHIMKNIDGVRWFQCIYCCKEFKKPSDLVRHIRIHTHEKPYKCTQCYRAFAVKSTLKAHSRTHTGAKDYPCEHCKKQFSTSGSLKVHLLLHSGAKPYSCSICTKKFRTTSHRNNHELTHQKVRKPRKSKKSTKAKLSELNVTSVPLQEPILITETGYVQPVPKNSAMYHQLLQAKCPSERPYRCQICDKAFKKTSHLKQHVRSHTGEKPYKCYQCDRTFVSNGVLKAHLKTHSGIKTFVCSECDASFTTNGSLKRHMSIHSSDRPYMCPYCQKTFKTSMNCKKHMNTHRYELALGLASGVAVTVMPEGAIVQDGEKGRAATHELKEGSAVLENGCNDITTELMTDGFTSKLDTDNLSEVPQHFSAEVFNTQTGMMEHVEIVPHTRVYNSSQNNIFSLSDTDFDGNSLMLQTNTENEEYTTQALETENPSAVSAILEPQDIIVETTEDEAKGIEKIKTKRRPKGLPYRCPQCNICFKSSSNFKQHQRSHTGEKPFRCSMCGDLFKRMKILINHIKTKHEGMREYPCKLCDSAFTSKYSLNRHIATHDLNRPLLCAYCKDEFSSKDFYKLHMKECHPETLTKHVTIQGGENNLVPVPNKSNTIIRICTEETEPDLMQLHETTVEQSPNVTNITDTVLLPTKRCDKPGKFKSIQSKFKDKGDKKEYHPKHLHVCSVCPKSFKKPSDLIRHMRIHTGERPYTCEKCRKSFSVKSTLEAHKKTHTGEKNYSCHVCNSLFSTKGSLKVHLRLHTGSRPFKCPHCDLNFRTSGHRKSHVASHYKAITPRKTKKSLSTTAQAKESVQQMEILPVVSLGEESFNVLQPGMQVANTNHTSIQLQPQTLIQPGIQFATVDPSMLSKPIQIDASVWQQLQQQFNLNITINPSLADQMTAKTFQDSIATQVVNVDNTHTATGTFNINPSMIVHPLGYAGSENVTFLISDPSMSKNGTTEIFQNALYADPHMVSLDGNSAANLGLVDSMNTHEEIDETVSFVDIHSALHVNASEYKYECSMCKVLFKSKAQLKRHAKSHKVKPKSVHQCETCSKEFKKKNQLLKHLTTAH